MLIRSTARNFCTSADRSVKCWLMMSLNRSAYRLQILMGDFSINYRLTESRKTFLVWSVPKKGSPLVRIQALGDISFSSAVHAFPQPMSVDYLLTFYIGSDLFV